MPGFTITRGFGPGATPTSLIARGFLPEFVFQIARRIVKGGSSEAKRVIQDISEKFKISAMLIARNGKEFTTPIFNSITKISTNDTYSVEVKPKSVENRQVEDIKIAVKLKNVREIK